MTSPATICSKPPAVKPSTHSRWPRWLGSLIACATPALTTSAATTQIGDRTFTFPDGLELSQVANQSLALRPVSGSFDDQGNLYITDSSGSNLPPAEQLKNPTHSIRRLRDTDADGVFDHSEIFADKVMFPQGCLWHGGSIFVAAPPSIWKFTDTNGDGVADKREEWFKGGTLTGCANDIHGPHLGPDGFIYWTKGAFAEQRHERPGKPTIHDAAAHIFRARPDGSGLETVMSGGMDNPVEVAFTAEGEPVFTSTFIDFSQPGWRDGVAHAVYGGVYGKHNSVIEDGRVIRTTPDLLHPFVQLGAGAPSGLCRTVTDGLGSTYQDNLFSTAFNLHKVIRHKLSIQGASYSSINSDLLACDSIDFHPTDVLEDADGSLVIIDTGGWYKLCCPTSQLAKPDVLGAIYRLKNKTGVKLSTEQRSAAYRKLASPPPLTGSRRLAELKRIAWEANPNNASKVESALHEAISSPEAPESAFVARLAAEALGRMQHKPAVPVLLRATAAAFPSDPFLSHALTFALIEIGDASAVREALASGDPRTQRSALMVLDQLKAPELGASDVIKLLEHPDEKLRNTAAWICERRPQWADSLAGYFETRLRATGDTPGLVDQVARFAKSSTVSQLVGRIAGSESASKESRRLALKVMARAGVKEGPDPWRQSVAIALADADTKLVGDGLKAAREIGPSKKEGDPIPQGLLKAGLNASLRPGDRLLALSLFPPGKLDMSSDLFNFVLSHLSEAQPVDVRGNAASVLATAKLSESQLLSLMEPLRQMGPLEIPRVLAAFEQTDNERVGISLIDALSKARSARSLRADVLRPRLKKYPISVQKRLEDFLTQQQQSRAGEVARLESMLAEVQGKGDIRRGQAIFNSAKAACNACHSMGYAGGNLGPDLTRIGEVRSERDLLEAILYPSASFVRSYEPMHLTTKNGDTHSGVIRKDSPEEVVLGTGPNLEVRLAKAEIAEMRPSEVSVMPQGLEEQISRQDLADLVAFLKNTRWGAR